ncbi:probetacellulin isoform X3 [Anolis carolinensis]|uniref:probetacellulin isoform X3 n=1 Tax=Anolis carolinensis TaxID=28377 RepID=UPI002F2B6772
MSLHCGRRETIMLTIWDAAKAVLRGHFIQQNAIRNKKRNEEMNKITNEIKKAEDSLKKTPKDGKSKSDLEKLHKQRTLLETEQTSKELKFIRQYHFENANKPGKWLARKIKKKRQSQQIIKLVSGDKIYTTDEDICTQFNKFYKKLYARDQIKKEDIQQFLNLQKLPKISDKFREELNKEITEQEIRNAIKKTDLTKAPGPDGFTAKFYKVYEEELIPYLKRLMNQALTDQKIPDSWKMAKITMIPKDNSDIMDVRNFRPISLLNIDYKLFANILADRLKFS